MNAVLALALWLAYLSLLAELVLLHVPSVASSYQLLSVRAGGLAGYPARWQRLSGLGLPLRTVLLILPLIVIYAVFAFPLAVTLVGPDPIGDYAFVPAAATQVMGVALLAAGRTLSVAAALTLRKANDRRDDGIALQRSGVFRWSRNPSLLGMFVFVTGAWLLAPSLAMAAGIVFYVAYMRYKVGLEEDFLRGRFGEAYDEYCRRTPRFLG